MTMKVFKPIGDVGGDGWRWWEKVDGMCGETKIEPYDPLKAVNYGVKLSSLLLLIIQDLYILYHIV